MSELQNAVNVSFTQHSAFISFNKKFNFFLNLFPFFWIKRILFLRLLFFTFFYSERKLSTVRGHKGRLRAFGPFSSGQEAFNLFERYFFFFFCVSLCCFELLRDNNAQNDLRELLKLIQQQRILIVHVAAIKNCNE